MIWALDTLHNQFGFYSAVVVVIQNRICCTKHEGLKIYLFLVGQGSVQVVRDQKYLISLELELQVIVSCPT